MSVAYRIAAGVGERGRTALRLVTAGCLAAAAAACSLSLPSFSDGDGPAETTGSIAKPAPELRFSADLGPEDWRRAKGALGLALDPQGNGRTVKWDNPETMNGGDVTPSGSPYVANDEICRRFTATVVMSAGARSRLAGQACRVVGDEWQLKHIATVP